MTEALQPHPRFAVPVLQAELANLRASAASDRDTIMYLTAVLSQLRQENAAEVESLRLRIVELEKALDDKQFNAANIDDDLGGGAGAPSDSR